MSNLTVTGNKHALILSLTNFFRLDHSINTPFEKQILFVTECYKYQNKTNFCN